jgi:chromosome segregation ATPase
MGATSTVCKIGVDERSRIAQLEADEQRLEAEKDRAERDASAFEQRLRKLKAAKTSGEAKRTELTNRINRIRIELENPPDDVDNFDAQIETVTARIAKIEREIDEKTGNVPAIEARLAQLRKDKKGFMTEIQELSGQLNQTDTHKAESDKLFNAQRVAEREFERERKILAELNEKINKQRTEADAARAKADDDLEKARRHSPHGELKYQNATRAPQALAVLLREEKQKCEEAQKLSGLDFNQVRADYHEAKLSVERAVKYLKELGEFLDRAQAALDVRKQKLLQIQSSLTRRAKISFLGYQRKRSYIGKLTFNHDNKSMNIRVKPKTDDQFTDVMGLSGGEKSYCLVALLLSMWEVMESPFYCVDEFDVFMDDVNRQAATNLLITGAEAMDNRQFIFLTPLSLDNVKNNEHCAIWNLSADAPAG